MKIALLLFGLLNSFDKVYGSKRARPSLIDAFTALGIDYDTYVDTSPIDFFKVPTGTSVDDIKSLTQGRPLIDRTISSSTSEQEYIIIANDEAEITHRLQHVFIGGHTSLNFTPADPSTWRGDWGDSLIMAFMERKERLVRAAVNSGIGYDYVILARPDYVIKTKVDTKNGSKISEDLSQIVGNLQEDLKELENSNTLGINQMGTEADRDQSSDILLIKNGYQIGRLYEMVLAANLANVVKVTGSYGDTYAKNAYRCKFCNTLSRNHTPHCLKCGAAESLIDISRWLEYKLGEHIKSSGIKWTQTRLFGRALR